MTAGAFREVHFELNGGLDEACNRAHQQRHLLNPWSVAMYRQPVERVVFSDEVVPLRPLQRTSFYDEVLRPQDITHNAMISLAAKADFRVAFNICRSSRSGPFEECERQILNGFIPHLRRSLLLGFRLEGYRAIQQAEYHALDQLTIGVILIDRRERIVYLNQSARSFCAGSGPLQLHDGKVETVSCAHTRQLHMLIRAARQGAPTGAMSLPRSSDGRLLTVLVASVRSRDLDRFDDAGMRDPAVLIFVVDPANRVGVPAEWLIQAYGLTQSEAKIALAVASGITVPEAALYLGVTANTIKTHLSRVFVKTGVSRQSELARLIASIGLLKSNGWGRLISASSAAGRLRGRAE
jgi:DNA-binding CsgD family transcriptional regulator